MLKRTLLRRAILAAALLFLGAAPQIARAQSSAPYIVEWVYKVKFGYQDEFWKIFQKYQIPVLNKEKEIGSVLRYEVFRPGLHTSEDHLWDYRIVIYYKDIGASSGGGGLEKKLFPDQATLKREETRRWELTEVHWDLPIRQVDPAAPAE